MEQNAESKFRAVLVSETDQLLAIEAGAFLREELRISSRYVTDRKPALLAALIDEAPTFFMLLHSDLFHFRVTARARRDRRDNPLRIMISRPFVVSVLDNCSHILPSQAMFCMLEPYKGCCYVAEAEQLLRRVKLCAHLLLKTRRSVYSFNRK